jgi:hypothetical protein
LVTSFLRHSKNGSNRLFFVIVKSQAFFIGHEQLSPAQSCLPLSTETVGLAFDSSGRLYVLENTTGNQFPTPGTGKVLRVNTKHNYTEIAKGLSLPTAMTFGPDGNLYVSSNGFGFPAGQGQIVKITLPKP